MHAHMSALLRRFCCGSRFTAWTCVGLPHGFTKGIESGHVRSGTCLPGHVHWCCKLAVGGAWGVSMACVLCHTDWMLRTAGVLESGTQAVTSIGTDASAPSCSLCIG